LAQTRLRQMPHGTSFVSARVSIISVQITLFKKRQPLGPLARYCGG
jgi:hypothetical protein